MKSYLSHGMGVNSTALMLLLEDEGIDFESVFVNNGGDYPRTYEYVEYLKKQGHKIKVIFPNYCGCHTIEEYALKYTLFPGIKFRWCTINFKVNVLYKYYEKPCIDYVGFSIDEAHRCKPYKRPEGINVEYPLVEKNVTREGCISIIKAHNLKVPYRSGCWLCPFMNKLEVRRLFLEDKPLYERRKKIEENVVSKRHKKTIYLSANKKSVSQLAMEDTQPLTSWFQ